MIRLKFVCLADTHMRHNDIEVPDGDILLCAGDFTSYGSKKDVKAFNVFLNTLPHKYKVVIAGNHDFLFEKQPVLAQSLLTNCIYLQDSSVEIEEFLIYGTPWQPWFYDWAFNLPRGKLLKEKWNLIPEDTDILITHGPPYGHGDKVIRNGPQGCIDLLDAIRRIIPKYHIFGHIHEGYGITTEGSTTCINASNVDINYKPVNKVITFSI
ncbi:MAG: metallophosphatase domain-containing protein [Promethearchaeota archaeon]